MKQQRVWIIACAVCFVLGGALLAVTLGSVLGGSGKHPGAAGAREHSAPRAAQAQRSAPQAVTPNTGQTGAAGTGGLAADGAIDVSRLVDPAWVEDRASMFEIPKNALAAYAGAALQVTTESPNCGLGWNTLAAIGSVESDHGRIHGAHLNAAGTASPRIIGIPLNGHTTDAIADTDGGRLDGDTVWDRAVGPMQFIPSTWAKWAADGNADGVKDPQNIADSALAAGRYLCSVGGDLTQPDRWIAAVASYNDTVEYNNRVADAANRYAE